MASSRLDKGRRPHKPLIDSDWQLDENRHMHSSSCERPNFDFRHKLSDRSSSVAKYSWRVSAIATVTIAMSYPTGWIVIRGGQPSDTVRTRFLLQSHGQQK